MLSPHEFATLMLIKGAPGQIDLEPTALDALLEHQLVLLENPASGHTRLALTARGHSVLNAVARFRPKPSRLRKLPT